MSQKQYHIHRLTQKYYNIICHRHIISSYITEIQYSIYLGHQHICSRNSSTLCFTDVLVHHMSRKYYYITGHRNVSISYITETLQRHISHKYQYIICHRNISISYAWGISTYVTETVRHYVSQKHQHMRRHRNTSTSYVIKAVAPNMSQKHFHIIFTERLGHEMTQKHQYVIYHKTLTLYIIETPRHHMSQKH